MRARRKFADGFQPLAQTDNKLTVKQVERLQGVGEMLPDKVHQALIAVNAKLSSDEQAFLNKNFSEFAR